MGIFGGTVQQSHVSALASLSTRQRLSQPVGLPGGLPAQAPRVPAAHQLVRRMDHFNQPLVVWRLISGNHRELGRGVGLFPSHAAAAAHASAAQGASEELLITFVQSQPARGFAWYATFRERPVLMASAWYPTIRDRDRSAHAALDLLGGARLLESVIRHGHRHLPVELTANPQPATAEGPERSPRDSVPALSP
ncbi:hypothetical protein [Pseudarthrobacter sulfonivorans]|uniref:hypothetical protein n=1 Tax=Pseudarthrobacter sulfonivorans TaxID=121292 RepID=UPI00210597AB|nr:hypothetical protein [Pseudarthrobacter sulfonivorans]